MNAHQIAYLVFGIVLLIALAFDLGLLSKRNKVVTIKAALQQTFFWVSLALAFFVFLWIQEGQKPALEYISAYLMEWSLSIDNIFVFILIFNSFGVKEKNYSRVLLIGIMMAIIFRIGFITVGVAAVEDGRSRRSAVEEVQVALSHNSSFPSAAPPVEPSMRTISLREKSF